MLILAGVAVSVLTEDGGLFGKTKNASKLYGEASENENKTVSNLMNIVDKYLGKIETDVENVKEEENYIFVDFKMPTLTANTCTIDNKQYMVTASTTLSTNFLPYCAFDGKSGVAGGECWHSAQTTEPQWLQIQFPNQVKISSFTIRNRDHETGGIKDFTLQGSNDGETWDDLGEYTNVNGQLQETEFSIDNANVKEYYYYRWYITSTYYASYYVIGEVLINAAKEKVTAEEIIGRIDNIGEVTVNSYKKLKDLLEVYKSLSEEDKKYITNYPKLATAINEYNSIENVLFEMPALTANTCTIDDKRYIVTASTTLNGNFLPHCAFDGKSGVAGGECWHSAQTSSAQWLQIQFEDKMKINKFTIANRDHSTGGIKDFTLQGSNDGENWDDLGTYTNTNGQLQETTFEVDGAKANMYYYYRWNITSTYYTSYYVIGEIIFNEMYVEKKNIEI